MSKAMVLVDGSTLGSVLACLEDRGTMREEDAKALVKAYCERGELATLLSEAETPREVEILVDANDDDGGTQKTLAEMHPRKLAASLMFLPMRAILWQCSPLSVVLAALLMPVREELARFEERLLVSDFEQSSTSSEEETDGEEEEEMDEEASDELSQEQDENEIPILPMLLHLAEQFGELFDEGIESMPIRRDVVEARASELGSLMGTFGELVVYRIEHDPRIVGLTSGDVSEWISFLLGEVAVEEAAAVPRMEVVARGEMSTIADPFSM